MKLLFCVLSIFLFFASGLPSYSMLAYNGRGDTTHNTDYSTAGVDISYLWNRTIQLGAGTGTLLGGLNGTYWMLTANHVSTASGASAKITSTDGNTYSFACQSSFVIPNPQSYSGESGFTSNTDLKLVKIVASNSATETYLNSLNGMIGIYTEELSSRSTLYTVGTGVSTNLGSAYDTGTPQKQWASFNATQKAFYDPKALTYQATSPAFGIYYGETFATSGTSPSFQATLYDSGSGVFIKDTYGNWNIVGVSGLIVANQDKTISAGTQTYFSDLAVYAENINSIISANSPAIPEPSIFSFFAGTLALISVGMRRRRCKN